MTTPPPFVIRSIYRSLLRSSKPFSPPSPNYAVYASLLHRSGISHDWEECIYNLEKKRAKLRRTSDGDDDSSNSKKKKNENIIPKSWARNLTRSYADLKEEYQMHKDSLASLHDDDDDDDEEEEDDDDWDEDVPIGSHHFHEQEYYNPDQDPKFILFRHLLREWFAGGHDTTKDEAIDNSWPRQWSPDEEGYYENGKIKQVPLMRFPSQIIGDCDGLSVREIIQREFRAVTVEEKYERECIAKFLSSSSSAAAVAQKEAYPPSSYIDNPIRLQTALYTLQELNRKLLWANKIGLPSPNDCTTRQAREWKRLVQAAKGVSVYPKEDEKCATANDDSPLETETVETKIDDANSTQSNDEPSTPKDDKKSAHPLDCGTLMIAHPLMTGYFANSVIILLDHTDARSKDKSDDSKSSSTTTTDEAKSSGGTYGLIVNRLALEANSVESTQSRLEILRQRFEEKKERDLAEVLLQSSDATETSAPGSQKTDVVTTKSTGGSARRPISLLQAVQNDDLPETVQLAFGDAPIREGGPVNLSIQMIHRAAVQNDLGAGATKEKGKKIGGTVIPSHFGDENLKEMETTFFGGDVINASYAVLEGVRDADDFSFIIGASCWSPGQLENEIQRGCWLRFCGPSSMAMTGMCDHYDATELKQLFGSQDEEDKDNAQGTKLSSFPPRPSNAATLSVAGSATRGSNNTQQSGERPVGDLWLSIMCALSQGEADLAYVMLNSSNVKDDLGDACDNFYR